ncbi:MAG: chemotaxis protein CheD [Phycisphaerae bacterium]
MQTVSKETKSPSSSSGKAKIHSIGIAGMKVVHAPEKISTVLGSCIGIAMYDRVAKIGGMAHIILPSSKEGSGDPAKFADTAVEMLLEQLVAAGAERKRVTAKIAGGAKMFGQGSNAGKLGERNAESVKGRLREFAIRIAAEAVGGCKGRKMCLDPATGEVLVNIIGQEGEIL